MLQFSNLLASIKSKIHFAHYCIPTKTQQVLKCWNISFKGSFIAISRKKMSKIDLVFVVGPYQKKKVSHIAKQLLKKYQGCRVASIHYENRYNSTLGRNIFHSFVNDFDNVYVDKKKSSGNPPKYGYPLHHVLSLSFRCDATRLCFLVSNLLPFNDTYEETTIYDNELENSQDIVQENNSNNITEDEAFKNENLNQRETQDNRKTQDLPSKSKSNEVYHEDPLLSCRKMAALGVVLYCIENMPSCSVFSDTYSALSYITGGQYMNIPGSQTEKAVNSAIKEEIALEKAVSNVQDYLCVAWLAWGKGKVIKPSSFEYLCNNIFNYLQTVNIKVPEILKDGKPLGIPSKDALKITTFDAIGEARRIKDTESNWEAECSWFLPEVCDDIIPGYCSFSTRKKDENKVTLSGFKPLARNQAERLLIRTLARQVQVTRSKQEKNVQKIVNTKGTKLEINVPTQDRQEGKENNINLSKQDVLETNVKEGCSFVKESKDLGRICICKENQEYVFNEDKLSNELYCSKELVVCKQDAFITEKFKETCSNVTCRNCVLV